MAQDFVPGAEGEGDDGHETEREPFPAEGICQFLGKEEGERVRWAHHRLTTRALKLPQF